MNDSPYQPQIDFNGASILITGGTGSFGKVFVRTLFERYTPDRVVVLSRDEMKHEEMQRLYPREQYPAMRFFLGDVRDVDRLTMAMADIEYVVHAAAQKIVPLAEYNSFECVHTNVLGMENVVRAALRNGVKHVIALSTDKAASPVNLYGATKLAADKICVAANHLRGKSGPTFSVVRYGNVLNSRGSVVPLFKRLLEESPNSDLPITDERMTRFWITLPQAVDFVMSCFEIMRGGEVFVPKIPSMRLLDLVEAIAPGKGYEIVGIRPGEKLHEAMITVDEARHTVDFGDRYIIEPNIALYERRSFRDDGASYVDPEFSYTSNGNDRWLTIDDLRGLIAD